MKKIIFTFFLFTSFDAYALPDCPDDISAIWNNCFGFSNMGNDGDTYEGEWKNDKLHGQGTYTFANGNKYVGNYKDGLRHIHPDPSQARTITVREAARLQSFPDDFFFEGPSGANYKMIGNAVPPKFSLVLAKSIYKIFTKTTL